MWGRGALETLYPYRLREGALNSLRCSCGRTAAGFLPEAFILLGQLPRPAIPKGRALLQSVPFLRVAVVESILKLLGSIQAPNRLHYAAAHTGGSSLQQKQHEAA